MNTMQRRIRILLATLGALGFAPIAASQAIYMVIPGVTGPVTTQGFVGAIEVLSYSQGFTNVKGVVTCSDTSLQKLVDQSSVFFARSVLEQRGPFNATLYFTETQPASLVITTSIKLKSATVTSVSHGAASGARISENISMHASSLVVSFNNNGVMQTYTTDCP